MAGWFTKLRISWRPFFSSPGVHAWVSKKIGWEQPPSGGFQRLGEQEPSPSFWRDMNSKKMIRLKAIIWKPPEGGLEGLLNSVFPGVNAWASRKEESLFITILCWLEIYTARIGKSDRLTNLRSRQLQPESPPAECCSPKAKSKDQAPQLRWLVHRELWK